MSQSGKSMVDRLQLRQVYLDQVNSTARASEAALQALISFEAASVVAVTSKQLNNSTGNGVNVNKGVASRNSP